MNIFKRIIIIIPCFPLVLQPIQAQTPALSPADPHTDRTKASTIEILRAKLQKEVAAAADYVAKQDKLKKVAVADEAMAEKSLKTDKDKLNVLEQNSKTGDDATKAAANQAIPQARIEVSTREKEATKAAAELELAKNALIAAQKEESNATAVLNSLASILDHSENPVTSSNEKIYKASLAALTKFFVVAVLLESGLALLINWTVFLAYFNRRVWRPVIMFVGALALVLIFDLDIVASLINAYNTAEGVLAASASGFFSKLLSALILAGGSAGVFNILVALGFRDSPGQDTPKPPGPEHAWLAVRVPGYKKGDPKLQVKIGKLLAVPADASQPLAGTVQSDPPKLRDLFFLSIGRWPSVAGYTLDANIYYKIEVCVGERDLLKGKGVYSFAPRAIVDLDVTYTDD